MVPGLAVVEAMARASGKRGVLAMQRPGVEKAFGSEVIKGERVEINLLHIYFVIASEESLTLYYCTLSRSRTSRKYSNNLITRIDIEVDRTCRVIGSSRG